MNSKTKPVIVLGAGGHAKVITEILNQRDIKVLGISVKSKKDFKKTNYKSFSDDEVISNYSPDQINLVNGVGSLPYDKSRYKISKNFIEKGYSFISITHPSAIISSEARISEGAQILAGSFVGPSSSIGIGTIINSHSSIDHDCEILEYCHLAPGVVCSGNVKIGNFVHISPGVTITNNIEIGNNSIIYPGVTLTKNIPDNSIVKPSLDNIVKNRNI